MGAQRLLARRAIVIGFMLPWVICGSCQEKAEDNVECGKGTWEEGEECDGSDLGGATCASQGYSGGELKCGSGCRYDTSACTSAEVCQNGRVEGTEECDGNDFRGKTCASVNLGSGALACTQDCRLITSGCSSTAQCSNGVADGTEECDGSDLKNQTCQSLGYDSGTLTCMGTCKLDRTACQYTGTTWFVRTNGGSATQCTGRVDAPYPGSGTNQACAWDHPYRALPPGGPARIRGGDTLIIGPGSYVMGAGAPDDNNHCEYSDDCYMTPIPSGPDAAHPTRILGAGCQQGCADPPELWGTEKVLRVINLTGSSNVLIAGLELTDHSSCVEFHAHGIGGSNLTCDRDYPDYGPWAQIGLYAEDSQNVTLRHLDIHGFSGAGVHAGRLTNWTVEDVRIVGNGFVGWDGDIPGNGSNSGTLTFKRVTIAWNGCAETYFGGDITGCWSQSAGGYGDGLGTDATGGDWIFEDCNISHNTSDGLDLLYHRNGGTVTIKRMHAEGNAGNQVKFIGPGSIESSVIIGNCDFFTGQPFTTNVDPCRAGGTAVELYYLGTGNEEIQLVGSTFFGHAGLIYAKPMNETDPPYQCVGTERLRGWNNVFLGGTSFFDPSTPVALFYQDDCFSLKLESDYSLAWNVRSQDDAQYVSPVFPSAHNLFRTLGWWGR